MRLPPDIALSFTSYIEGYAPGVKIAFADTIDAFMILMSILDNVFRKKSRTPPWTAENNLELALGSVKQQTSCGHHSSPCHTDFPISTPPSPHSVSASLKPQFSPIFGNQPGPASYFSRRPTIESSPPQIHLQIAADNNLDIDEIDIGVRFPSPTTVSSAEARSFKHTELVAQQEGAFQDKKTVQRRSYYGESRDFTGKTLGNKGVTSGYAHCGIEKTQGHRNAMVELGRGTICNDSNERVRQKVESNLFTIPNEILPSADHQGRTSIEARIPVKSYHKRPTNLQQTHQTCEESSVSKPNPEQRSRSILQGDMIREPLYSGNVDNDNLTQSLQRDHRGESKRKYSHESLLCSGDEEMNGGYLNIEKPDISDSELIALQGNDTQVAAFRGNPPAIENALLGPSKVVQPFAHVYELPILDQYAWSPCASDDGIDQKEGQIPRSLSEKEDSDFEEYPIIRDNPNLLQMPLPVDPGQTRPVFNSSKLAGDLHRTEQVPNTSRAPLSNETFGHLSGFLSDGSSSRPMSEQELHQTLNEFVRYNMRASSSFASFRQAGSIRTGSCSRNVIVQIQHSTSDDIGDRSAQNGPGSSQTTSSRPAESLVATASSRSREARPYKISPSSQFRSPTPPLLFGRMSMQSTSESSSSLRPSRISTDSGLPKASYSRNVPDDSYRSGLITFSGDQDWVTETDIKTSAAMKVDAVEGNIGSSLADNSDPGSLSPRKRSSQGLESKDYFLHHSPHARYNHSWTLRKNVQTGEIALLPDLISHEGIRLTNVNTSTPLRMATNTGQIHNYQHPIPLVRGHTHPFSSSPPVLAPAPHSPSAKDDGYSVGRKTPKTLSSLESQTSETSTEIEHVASPRSDSRKTGSVSRAHKVALVEMQKQAYAKQGKPPLSSTWLNTADEDQSKEPSLPLRIGSFGRTTTLGARGNLTGTSDGAGMREAGSSLADGSSPGVKFSSSPAPIITSPPTKMYRDWDDYSDVLSFQSLSSHPFSAQLEAHREEKYQNNLPPKKMAMVVPASSLEERARGLPLQLHAADTSKVVVQELPEPADNYLCYLPLAASSAKTPARSSRQRRSSSEYESTSKASPRTAKVATLQWSTSGRHKRSYATGLVPIDQAFGKQDLESGMRLADGDADSSPCRSKRKSQSRALFNKTHTSTQERSVIGSASLQWERHAIRCEPTLKKKRPLDVLVPRIQPRSIEDERPFAHTDTPQLHRIPESESPELIGYHKLLSRVYLIPCFVPFLGVLYGHGMFDCVIRWHTKGKIEHFRKQEKVFMLAWSYCIMILIIAGLVLAAILCSD